MGLEKSHFGTRGLWFQPNRRGNALSLRSVKDKGRWGPFSPVAWSTALANEEGLRYQHHECLCEGNTPIWMLHMELK